VPPVADIELEAPRPWCESAGLFGLRAESSTPTETEAETDLDQRDSNSGSNTALFALTPRPVSARIMGSFDRSAVSREIRSHQSELRACYEGAFLYGVPGEGRVVLDIDIGVDGGVTGVEVSEDELDDPCVARCLMWVARSRWSFQIDGRIVQIRYPLLFEAL